MTDPSPAEALERAVAKLHLGQQRRHIFLCVAGEKCAPAARSEESWVYLKRRFRELGLVDVDGGTGRFAKAKGKFVIHSIFNLIDMQIVYSEVMPGGRIRY